MTALLPARSRSDRAFERLYQKHVGDVYRYALAVLASPADAEDVTQTAFLNAYRAFEKGQRPERPLNWLIAITHNVCRQRFRQAARRPSEVELDFDVADELVEDEAPRAEDIRRALSQLAFNQRAALVMRELEGRSYAEIAEVLEVSQSAVETLVFRARRALREQLEGLLGCGEAELAISRQLDGTLARSEKGALRAHLRACRECASLARKLRAQRSLLRGFAVVPLPSSLTSFFGGGAATATAVGTGTAALGSGLAIKAVMAGAAALLVAGGSYEAVTHNLEPGGHRTQAAAASSSREPAMTSAAARPTPVGVAAHLDGRVGQHGLLSRGHEPGSAPQRTRPSPAVGHPAQSTTAVVVTQPAPAIQLAQPSRPARTPQAKARASEGTLSPSKHGTVKPKRSSHVSTKKTKKPPTTSGSPSSHTARPPQSKVRRSKNTLSPSSHLSTATTTRPPKSASVSTPSGRQATLKNAAKGQPTIGPPTTPPHPLTPHTQAVSAPLASDPGSTTTSPSCPSVSPSPPASANGDVRGHAQTTLSCPVAAAPDVSDSGGANPGKQTGSH